MQTLILDGSHPNDPMSERVLSSLQANLDARNWQTQIATLREKKIGVCAGDFFCWVRSPGLCNTDDDNRIIAQQIMQSDLVVYLTPVTFGGFSSALKRMMDHQIQNISPFFRSINGEIHHQKRYQKYPNVLFIGWMDEPDAQAEAIFRHLVQRVSINMNANTAVCGLVTDQPSDLDLTARTGLWLEAVTRGSSSPVPALPAQTFPATDTAPVRRAVLLVGSPRTKNSTSASLGGYLFEQLSARGVETQTIQIHTSVNSQERMAAMYTAIDNADLVVLAFPLYVDSLPAPVISALEKISAYRKGDAAPIRFSAIVNCGFPGANHNDTAIAISSEFARQNGFAWMGGLSLGAGQGIVHGAPLNELDGRAIPLRQALNLAAEALANGQPIPQPARDLFAKPIIPGWMYTFMGRFGWEQQAKHYGVQSRLKARPYEKTRI